MGGVWDDNIQTIRHFAHQSENHGSEIIQGRILIKWQEEEAPLLVSIIGAKQNEINDWEKRRKPTHSFHCRLNDKRYKWVKSHEEILLSFFTQRLKINKNVGSGLWSWVPPLSWTSERFRAWGEVIHSRSKLAWYGALIMIMEHCERRGWSLLV